MPREDTQFKVNNLGKPKGAVSKKCEFENFLFDNFVQNKDKAQELLNAMYQNKLDFKWLMGLLTERMPKESSISTEITNTEKKIIIEIDKNDRDSKPQTQRLPAEIL